MAKNRIAPVHPGVYLRELLADAAAAPVDFYFEGDRIPVRDGRPGSLELDTII